MSELFVLRHEVVIQLLETTIAIETVLHVKEKTQSFASSVGEIGERSSHRETHHIATFGVSSVCESEVVLATLLVGGQWSPSGLDFFLPPKTLHQARELLVTHVSMRALGAIR